LIANIAQFWHITRELDINGLRESFEQPVSLRVLGSDQAIADRVARLIEPDPEAGEITAAVLGETPRERADAYIAAIGGPLEAEARRELSDLSVGDAPVLVVQSEDAAGMLVLGIPDERIITLGAAEADDEVRDRLFRAMVQAAPEVILSAGRRHPLLREPIADHLIFDTARVNAQFAALASLPAALPLFGGLVGEVADTIVLTKNQVLLLFKLAGLYGRDIEFGPELPAGCGRRVRLADDRSNAGRTATAAAGAAAQDGGGLHRDVRRRPDGAVLLPLRSPATARDRP
jgi:hypothetical protein